MARGSLVHQKVWDKVLADNEEVVLDFSVSEKYRKVYLVGWIIVSFGLLFIYGLGLLFLGTAWFYYGWYLPRSRIYALTNKRIVARLGWLSAQTSSIDYERITNVVVHEPWLEQMASQTGNVGIETAGSNRTEIIFEHIDKPHEIKKQIESLKRK